MAATMPVMAVRAATQVLISVVRSRSPALDSPGNDFYRQARACIGLNMGDPPVNEGKKGSKLC